MATFGDETKQNGGRRRKPTTRKGVTGSGAAGGGGDTTTTTTTPGFQSDVFNVPTKAVGPSASAIDAYAVPILSGTDDPLGLRDLFPSLRSAPSRKAVLGAEELAGAATTQQGVNGPIPAPGQAITADIEYRVASVAKLGTAQQQQLGAILAASGIISQDKKGYKTSTLQSGLRAALEQTDEAGAKSLSDYLTSRISDNQSQGLGEFASPTSGETAQQVEGQTDAYATDIQAIANNYAIPLSRTAAANFASSYVNGGMDETQAVGEFTKYAQQTAAGLYPTLAPQITQGIDTKTLLDPYAQLASNVLGVNPDSIQWSDPQWSKALNGGVDPKTGRAVPMSPDQWANTMRSDASYGWAYTHQAKAVGAGLAQSLAQAFGLEGANPISSTDTTAGASVNGTGQSS